MTFVRSSHTYFKTGLPGHPLKLYNSTTLPFRPSPLLPGQSRSNCPPHAAPLLAFPSSATLLVDTYTHWLQYINVRVRFHSDPSSSHDNKLVGCRYHGVLKTKSVVGLVKEWYIINVIGQHRECTRTRTKNKDLFLEPNHNTTTTALDRAVTIPTLTYPHTAAMQTVEYSVQWSASSPLDNGPSALLAAPV